MLSFNYTYYAVELIKFATIIISADVILLLLFIDGCEEEEYEGVLWPETSVRYYANEFCPCSDYVGYLAGRATRYCVGDYINGAYWSSSVNDIDCAITKSTVTQQLCEAVLVKILCCDDHSYNWGVNTI